MSKAITSSTLIVLSAFALAGCGGDGGGGGGGGGGDGTAQKAATAGITARLAAKIGEAAADQADDEDDSSTQSLRTKQAEACSDGGSIAQTTASRSSPFLSSDITVERTVADNCRESSSGDGFSSSSRQDGILELGEAEQGTVQYIRASDIDDDPASGSPFILQSSFSSSQTSSSFNARLQGELNICDGCSSPTMGGTQELLGYFSFSFEGDGAPGFSATYGDGPNDPIALISTIGESTTATSIDGRFGFDDGADCSVTAVYDTISPIITETETGLTTSGELEVAFDSGEPVRVVFNSDGSATINGETFTAEDLAQIEDKCASSLEQSDQPT
jgi:hypothetical protein